MNNHHKATTTKEVKPPFQKAPAPPHKKKPTQKLWGKHLSAKWRREFRPLNVLDRQQKNREARTLENLIKKQYILHVPLSEPLPDLTPAIDKEPELGLNDPTILLSTLPVIEDAHTVIDPSKSISLDELSKAKDKLIPQFILDNMISMGILTLFPVQTEVIPYILHSIGVGGDFCVCSPTGSGKTLAYVIPIVQTLVKSVIQRVRALVLVPTHDLVVQVADVFRHVAKGTKLVVEPLYGDKRMALERLELCPKLTGMIEGGASLVDIVVSTPGRLIEHLNETPGFTLQHLQFLVIDEADRLLMQHYFDWVNITLDAIYNHSAYLRRNTMMERVGMTRENEFCRDYACPPQPLRQFQELVEGHDLLPHSDLVPKKFGVSTHIAKNITLADMERETYQLQKLLFSATLTKNPETIASLKLVNPHYFTATFAGTNQLYQIPISLEQNIVVCCEEEKPLVVLYILKLAKVAQVLCFTRSIETTHRLCLLLNHLGVDEELEGTPIMEYSSAFPQQERNQIMAKLKSGEKVIVISSDVTARGLDVETIGAVINYDIPMHIKGYIHRVGRTARAGRAGKSYTLVLPRQVSHFEESLKKAENGQHHTIVMPYEEVKKYQKKYLRALKHLERDVECKMKTNPNTMTDSQGLLHVGSKNPKDLQVIKSSFKNQLEIAWFEQEQSMPIVLGIDSHASLDGKIEADYKDQDQARLQKSEISSTSNHQARKQRRHRKGDLEEISLSSSESDRDIN